MPADTRVCVLGPSIDAASKCVEFPRCREQPRGLRRAGSPLAESLALNKIGGPPTPGRGWLKWFSTFSCRINSGFCRFLDLALQQSVHFREIIFG
jgi:hypothetical protein